MVAGTVKNTEPDNEEIKKKKNGFSYFLVNFEKSLFPVRSLFNIQMLRIQKESISKWSFDALQAGLVCLESQNMKVGFAVGRSGILIHKLKT